MASPRILDSHVHLWPGTSTSPENHAWIQPGHIFAKQHGISDYKTVTSSSPVQPAGFIYVETDRYLPAPRPNISTEELENLTTDNVQKLREWAHEPLQELRFLRRIVERSPAEGDGFLPSDSDKMVGCVIWAPLHLPQKLFNLYLSIAEEVSGPILWSKVVGFRYLLQFIKQESTLRDILQSDDWQQNMLRLRKGRNGKGWTFDIAVDAHLAGVWQLEAAADMVEKMRELESDGENGRWFTAMKRFAALPAVYVKLSGAFNGFGPAETPADVDVLVERVRFSANSVFELFGEKRVMFGSDWPVCNWGGPKGELENWELWREVVVRMLEGLGVRGVEDVWSGTACQAYGVEI
ncbi:hypothetical protein M011DRAFT_395180 [Sporormia fimetaria CBS 119925]|uniref:Amidohydrolase-related domain-containing protein n=1 Tax=Sporormia fimetaria CBS 119925 TaxID=1340428 RepID=A0A6A6VQ02_9PLEO|nr:hypothetical protein M011DRAFT_395180 [Sporormia fimetaria CBS 119925]